MKKCNEKIICLNCGWSGLENELKLVEATFIINCPEEVEVCPKCGSAELEYDCSIEKKMSSIKFTEQNKTDFYPNFEDKYKTTSALGLAYIDYVYVNQCEKESNHLTNNNNQFEDLFVVEKRKGEWDFSIKATIASLSYIEMNKFRSMIIVAIGAAENMWKRYQIQNEQNKAKSDKE